MKEDNIPSWLNEEYFKLVLSYKVPEAELISYEVTPAVQGGNNYCSRMWRVKINYKVDSQEVKSTSIMVKTALPEGAQKQFFDEAKFVDKEVRFYNELLPEVYKITDNVSIFPKNYQSTVPNTIVLDDLREQGYKMCDRLDKLDFEHCRVLMETLAEFHALSVKVGKQKPEIFESISEESLFIRENKTSGIFNLCKSSLIGLSHKIKSWKGFERFEYISEDKLDVFYDRTVDVFSPSKNLNVLNHGDIWTNNIMFKYDEAGKVIGAKMVDFQMCRKGSPGIDLHYFMWTSMKEDVIDNRLEELFDVYRKSLNTKLEEIGCEERLSEEQFQEELLSTRFYGFFILCVMLPFFLGDPDHPIDMDKLLDKNEAIDKENEAMARALENKHLNKVVPKVLLHLEDTIFDKLCKS